MYRTYARGLKERGESFDGYQVTVSLSAIVTKDNPDTVWERLRPHYQYRRAFFDKIIAEFGDTPLSGTPAGEIATAATKPGVLRRRNGWLAGHHSAQPRRPSRHMVVGRPEADGADHPYAAARVSR